ncbi:mst101(2) [Culex quinquefasciatus]|uniref:Mst101(2) n=1 Tax=Culex quinquefasciatus TaxID=7176 RepID=B0WRF6_CULQU|nr:mst101(2) [Culex quinquefasciatus]|eukprot:XP_001851290.1 mst101(2) [Culex quinquefasciatus]
MHGQGGTFKNLELSRRHPWLGNEARALALPS